MKKISLRIFVILIFTIVSSMVFLAINPNMTRADVKTSEDGRWIYRIKENNKIKIMQIDVKGEEGELIIPSKIDGYDVDEVSNQNDQQYNYITTLTVSEGIESIESLNLENVSRVILPSTLKKIGITSFMNCKKLENVNIPENVEEIGDHAFAETEISEIEIPKKVIRIGNGAFYNCEKLRELSIPISVTEIEGNPFEGCNNLTIKCEKQSEAYKWAKANEKNYGLRLDVSDTIAPTCTITSNIKNDITNTDRITYTLEFSEKIEDFSQEKIFVTDGEITRFECISEDQLKYEIEVTTQIVKGDLIVGLKEESCKDEAGNCIEGEIYKKITIDKEPPTCHIETEEEVTNKDSVIYKIKFSEEVQGITADIINVENGTKGILGKKEENGETYYTLVVTNTQSGRQVVTIGRKKYKDIAGNYNQEEAIKTIIIDKDAPIIESIKPNITETTNSDIILTVNATDAISGIEGYSWDGQKTWSNSNQVIIKSNGEYTVYVKDRTGNISSKTIEVTNIKKEPEKLAISATKYKVDGNYIKNIKPETKMSEIINDVKSNIEYEIQKKDGTKLTNEEIVGTGYKVKFATGETYEIVVNGDVNGDGKITVLDLAKIKKHIIGLETLAGVYQKAGDVDANDTITITDLAKIKKVIIGLDNL